MKYSLKPDPRLFNEVRSTYFNIYFNRRAIEITRENLSILVTFQNLANIKVEAGKVSARGSVQDRDGDR